jgi:hypothetical protein
MPRTHPKGLIFSSSKKENPINFSSMGIGARGKSIRNRISRAVFVPNRGVNFVDGPITMGIKSVISSMERINVAELGTSNTFTVKLDRKPLNKSAIIIEGGDATEINVYPKRVEFDGNTWNNPVTITITGVDDSIVDANIDTYIKVSVLYGDDVKLIPVRNYDDDGSQQIVFANLTNTTINKTEGSVVTISVYLTKAPTANTNISVTSNTDAVIATISPAIMFTPSNYNTPQTITLPIIDDEIDNTSARNVELTFTESETSSSSVITVNVDDNDVIGINHTAVPAFIYEGQSFTIDLSLSKIPEGNVDVITTVSDPRLTVANAARTFTSGDYSTTQTVQILAEPNNFSLPEEVFDISFTFTAESGGGEYISTKTTQFIVRASDITITDITSTAADAAYNTGTIAITIAFNATVNVAGTPKLSLNIGRSATYVSGTGSNTLTFNYVIASGDNTNDLDYLDTSALVLDGGSIRDTYDNNATLTLFAPGQSNSLGANKSIVVLTTLPTISIGGSNPVNIIAGDTYTDEGATATDAFGTSLSVSTINNVPNPSTAGTYNVVYSATDAAGNTQTATRTVNVAVLVE